MLDEYEESLIRITHFETPHLFYFKSYNDSLNKTACKLIIENEKRLLEYLDEFGNESDNDELIIGDVSILEVL